jgi:hypothetical protein
MSLLDRIREASAEVCRRARFVHLDRDFIAEYAALLPVAETTAPVLDPARHFLEGEEGTLAYFVTLDAINFGSGYFPQLRKRPGMSGYFTVATSLGDHFRAQGPLSAEALVRLTPTDCFRVFEQERPPAAIAELMALFADALNRLGRFLLDGYRGSFRALVESAGGSAENLAGTLGQMQPFHDVTGYQGIEVPFFKRAQLTAADLAVAFRGEGLGRFHDLDRLTIFADNLVPHVLRVDGLLLYEAELAARIDREELIPAGSPEEVEIRAAAVHAVELLAAELDRAGRPVTAMDLDYLLWNRGQQPHYKRVKPRHRTKTVFY